ncbi:hypothetical protein O181_072769 [Austropuccinia psidii MF-1]|uniref:Uncharacterized protein n=1 Tax=Austropuccinia psidii MF-1 TaxID=1389203 RepID=A0A9Q3F5E2_9BASI|nr:hypothetical protein [Austropuccinia psidii MF-1]
MRTSLKAQTHFNTTCKVWVITPHGATQQFGMLTFVDERTSAPPPGYLTPLPCLFSCLNWLLHRHLILTTLTILTCPHRPPIETPTLPPIPALTTPYAFTPPRLPSLCSRGALPTCLQHNLPSLRLRSACRTFL